MLAIDIDVKKQAINIVEMRRQLDSEGSGVGMTHCTTPRVRFNNGYFDGLDDQTKGRRIRTYGQHLFCLPKWDSLYCQGYLDGYEGTRSITNAWKTRPKQGHSSWMPRGGNDVVDT